MAISYADHTIAGMFGPPFNTIRPEVTGGLNPFRAHDALPADMKTHWSWYRGAVRMRWNEIKIYEDNSIRETPILTGRFGDAEPDTHGHNYRCHVRNYQLWYYGATSRTWRMLDDPLAKGAHYDKYSFAKTGSITPIRESDGSVSFPAKVGNWIHFYTGRWPYRYPAERFLYLHARGELKLSGTNASTAKVLGNVGIDYKAIGPDGTSVNGYVVPAALASAVKYVTPTYQWYTATTMYANEIRATPPPAPPGFSGSDDEVDPPEPPTIFLPRRSMIIVP